MQTQNNKFFQRFVAMLLCLAMVLPMVPVPAFAADAQSTGSGTSGETIVIAASDFQPEDDSIDTGKSQVSAILTQMVKDYSAADGFLFCGDYDQTSFYNTTECLAGKTAMQEAVQAVYGTSMDEIYVQGNHDPDSFTTDGTLSPSGNNDTNAYGVYVINEKDYMWKNNEEATVRNTSVQLKAYLTAKIKEGYSKPIFVVSHLPLHYNMRTYNDGDGQYANYIFDVLNEAGANGLNIFFLFGHDHSNGWDDYLGGSAVYLAKGDSINIAQASKTEFDTEKLEFTYLNAGYVGHYKGVNDGSERDLTMTVFQITDDAVNIHRYSASGEHDLKSVGVTNAYKSETAYAPDTRTYGSPQAVTLNKSISDPDAGVAVSNMPEGMSVKVVKAVSQIPAGYSAYQSYDITATGHTEGVEVTVTITLDSTFDASRPVFIIDHEKHKTIPVQIVDGAVTFTTDHFSLYTVAQADAESVSATGTIPEFAPQKATELTAGTYYVVESYLDGWPLTGNSVTNQSGYASLELKDVVTANGDRWYYDGTHLRHGDDESGYIMVSTYTAYLAALDDANNKRLVSDIYLNTDGETFTLHRSDSDWYLNQYGGKGYVYAAGWTENGDETDGSKWYFYTLADAEATFSVIPSMDVLTTKQTAVMIPTVTVDGTEHSNYTVAWASEDESIATVDENGVVTPKKVGQVYVTATLSAVEGIALTSPISVRVLLTVADVSKTDDSVTATTKFDKKLEKLSPLVEGGPYVIVSWNTGWVLTGNHLTADSEGFNGHNGQEGLELISENDFNHVWYYNGTSLQYGSTTGTDNYLVYDSNGEVTLGANDSTLVFDTFAPYSSSSTSYCISNSNISDANKYLNHYGGAPSNTAGVYSSAYYSRWYFYSIVPERTVALTVSPKKSVLCAGQSTTLTPTVTVDGSEVSGYTLAWTSSDLSVATVDENGVVTALSGGNVTITASLTAADGTVMDAALSVEIPIQVPTVTTTDTSVTATMILDKQLQPVTTLEQGIPYIITSTADPTWVLTNTTKTSDIDTSYTGFRLEHFDIVGTDHVWYYVEETVDGVTKQYLKYGSQDGTDNYLLCNYHTLQLGVQDSEEVDTIVADSGQNTYALYNSSTSRYVNQLGGKGYDTAVSATWDNGRFYFNTIIPEQTVSMTVSADSFEVYPTGTTELTPVVMVDGVEVTDYKVTWSTADHTIASVYRGVVTGVKGGTVNISATLHEINGEKLDTPLIVDVPITVVEVQSATITSKTANVAQRASAKVPLVDANGDQVTLTVTYADGNTAVVPVTVSMLTDAEGDRVSTYDAGTFTGLTVNFGGYQLFVGEFTLNVIAPDQPDYPAYPAEGSVYVNKTGLGVNFQSSGVAQIELSAAGVPSKTGVDVVIMLDTSSSMNKKVGDNTRISVLTASLNNLLDTLQTKDADGNELDIRVAIADFNTYYDVDEYSQYHLDSKDKLAGTSAQFRQAYSKGPFVYTGDGQLDASAFVDVHTLGTDENPFYYRDSNGDISLHTQYGTNYDYAFDAVYQLGSAITEANSTGKERDLFVIFMSDGAPFQYNYFSSTSAYASWNDWLKGNVTSDMFADGADQSYYFGKDNTNGNGINKHWMAEAIKGDPTKDYPVIRKNDTRDTDGDNWIDVPGLGATMYSIGFCLLDDNQITTDSMDTVIQNLASSKDFYFKADTADELDDAFNAISEEILYAASDAYYVDEMGVDYDLLLKTHTYAVSQTESRTITPVIDVKSYSLWTHQEAADGLCSTAKIGTRKDIDPLTIEQITFSADGTAAYSSVIGSTTNILTDGVICANTFWYNTTGEAVTITLDNGKTYSLPSETFYWKLGTISTRELVLSYYVYLTDALDENGDGEAKPAGIYDTNKSATLYYTNYLGNPCQLDVPSPQFPWNKATVGYGFYLVNKNGDPIVNQITGQAGSFQQAVKFDSVVYTEFEWNTDAPTIVASELVSKLTAAGYKLYDAQAKYDVSVNSNGTGSYTIYSDGTGVQTTYVTGITSTPITGGTVAGDQRSTTDFASAATVVWFAVMVDEGALTVNKTVAKDGNDYMLTLEAFANSQTSQISSVEPADIVLVLDQSSSMYTPLGWDEDRVNLEDGDTYDSINEKLSSYKITDFVAQANTAGSTVQENAKRMGYYIAIHNSGNYMYLVHYAEVNGTWGWYYISIDQTTRSIGLTAADYASPSGDSSLGDLEYKLCQWDNGAVFTGFSYYKTQYGALVESVESFVTGLQESGVDHRVGIVGFASPFYDGWDHYDGTGLYVDGKFYLYDTDFMYKGTSNGNGTYTFNADAGYDESLWTGYKVLDPDASFADGDNIGYALEETLVQNTYLNGIVGKTANGALTGETMYDDALISIKDGYSSIMRSVDAINANYQQTCPSVGIEIAENIFAARSTVTSDRDKIIVLFTDGVPTVRLQTNRHHGYTKDINTNALYWSISGGVEDALDRAVKAKTNGVQIYTIGTAAMENVAIPGTNIDSGDFLSYLSSNYAAVTYGAPFVSMIQNDYATDSYGGHFNSQTGDPDTSHTDTTGRTRYYTYHDATTGDGTGDDLWTYYYRVAPDLINTKTDFAQFAAASNDGSGADLNLAFDSIMSSITEPSVKLDRDDILRDVLSDYFDLKTSGSTPLVEVYTAAMNADGTFADPVLLSTAVVTYGKSDPDSDRLDIINVSGYSYMDEYLSTTPRDRNGEDYYGSKLIVKIPVVVREGFWGGNNVPTNEDPAAIYDVTYLADSQVSENVVTPFPLPQVNVPAAEISANDVTVYYGDQELGHDDLMGKVTADGVEVKINADGTFAPAEEWMDDFSSIQWGDNDTITSEAPSTTTPDTYTYSVVFTPTDDGAQKEGDKYSNIVGTPISTDGVTLSADANVYVLVPTVTYQDSFIEGIIPDQDYFNSTNLVKDVEGSSTKNPGVVWTLMGDATEVVNLTGTEPTLTFTYTPDRAFSGKYENYQYYKYDTQIQVTVTSSNGNEDITNMVTFHWVDCTDDLHTTYSTYETIPTHLGSVATFEFWVHVNSTSYTVEDVVVIDYGLSVDIDLVGNDIFKTEGVAELAGIFKEKPTMIPESFADAVSASGQFGEIQMNYTDNAADGTVRYTLNRSNGMQMDTHETFHYMVEYGEGVYYFGTVTIIPATTMYFEEDFLSFDDAWTGVTGGNSAATTQDQDRPGADVDDALGALDADNVYGKDSAYMDDVMYSNGSAMKTTVYTYKDFEGNVTSEKDAAATFRFTGTGFDVVSLTSNKTGVVLVNVFQLDDNGARIDSYDSVANDGTAEDTVVNPFKNYIVDTYYGYTYQNGEWVVTGGETEDAIYQIPVIKVEDLPYDLYEVEIYVAYNEWFGHDQYTDDNSVVVPKYDFYLDAIRIYDPANDGAGNDTIRQAYLDDGEAWPSYEELRDMLLPVDDENVLALIDNVEDLRDQLAPLAEEKSDLEAMLKELEALPDQITKLQAECDALEQQLESDPENAELQTALTAKQKELQEKQQRKNYLEGRKSLMEARIEELVEQIAPIQQELTTQENALTTALNDAFQTVVFIDGNEGVIGSDYTHYGPNNELYLKVGQSVAFELDAADTNIAQVHLAMKSLNGAAYIQITSNGTALTPFTVGSSTDLYYDITGLGNVTITNLGDADNGIDGILSITNVKTTYKAEPVSGSGDGSSDGTVESSPFTLTGAGLVDALMLLSSEPVTDPELTLSYPSLSFEDEIFYNVYFTAGDVSSVVEMGLMILPSYLADGTMADAIGTVPGYVTNGSVYMVKSEGIAAAYMGDTMYFKVYAKLSDGSYVYSGVGGYNAKAYAETILSGDYTDAMKSLVVAMVNYGAEAQLYFGHNTDALVNSALTDEQKALVNSYDESMVDAVVSADSTKTANFVRVNSNFSALYPSVSFDGAFSINYYCTPAITVDSGMTLYWWDAETYASIDAFTIENATGSMEMTENGGQYWGNVSGIAAKDMDKTYYVSCVFESEGETVTTGIISYSLGKYCEGKAATDGDAQQAFAQATAVYGYYAKQYFAQN